MLTVCWMVSNSTPHGDGPHGLHCLGWGMDPPEAVSVLRIKEVCLPAGIRILVLQAVANQSTGKYLFLNIKYM